MTPYQNLANAIILQAVKDYRKALKALRINPHAERSRIVADSAERFFLSDWFCILTEVDGKALMLALQKEVTA